MSSKAVVASEELIDSCSHFTGWLIATIRAQVLPKNSVVHVTREVEGKVLLKLVDPGQIVLIPCLSKKIKSAVGSINVGKMMLVVMQFHDSTRDVWL